MIKVYYNVYVILISFLLSMMREIPFELLMISEPYVMNFWRFQTCNMNYQSKKNFTQLNLINSNLGFCLWNYGKAVIQTWWHLACLERQFLLHQQHPKVPGFQGVSQQQLKPNKSENIDDNILLLLNQQLGIERLSV